jgi:hypothetical protein
MTIAGPADIVETTGGTCKDTFKIVVSIAVVDFVAVDFVAVVVVVIVAAVDVAFTVAVAIVVIVIAFAVCCCLVKLIIIKNVDFRLNRLFLQSSANQVIPTICGVNTGQHSKYYNLRA